MQYSIGPTITRMSSPFPGLSTQATHHNISMNIQDSSLLNNTLVSENKKGQVMSLPGLSQEQLAPASSAPAKHAVPFNGLSFHNPFDVNSYPLTNPPLYDPTMIPYGGPGTLRRRRISISNGQIGQIVNHEAFYVDDDSVDEYYDDAGQAYRPAHSHSAHPHANPHQHQHQHPHPHAESHPVLHRIGSGNGTSSVLDNSQTGLPVTAAAAAAAAAAVGVPPLNGDTIAPALTNDRQNGVPPMNSHDITGHSAVAGVPPQNHTLVYNNEVIYNPNDGPIPGTAAWKKERLLERNRLAASKCRQRKKQAQQQLQTNMAKFEKDLAGNQQKLKKAERLIAMYNSTLQSYFNGNTAALETLRPLITQPLDNIEFEQ